MKEHILITGGAGFIGSHLTDILIARGYRVRIFDNLLPIVHGMGCAKPAYLNPLAEFVKGDIREFAQVEEALNGIDAVYHLAALTGVGQSMYEIKDYVDVNISGTSNLLQAIVNNKTIKKIILASSRAVYGEGAYICDLCGARFPQARTFEQLNQGKWDFNCITCNKSLRPIPTSEEKPLDPISIYGITKKVQEELFRCAGQAYHVPFVILVAEENAVHNARAFGGRKEFVADADKTARRRGEVHLHGCSVALHVAHDAEALPEHLNDRARMRLWRFDGNKFHWLLLLAVSAS